MGTKRKHKSADDDKMQADSLNTGDPGSCTSEHGNDLQTARPTRAGVSDEVAQEVSSHIQWEREHWRSASELPEWDLWPWWIREGCECDSYQQQTFEVDQSSWQIRESSGHEEQHSRSFHETSCEEIGTTLSGYGWLADGGTNEKEPWWQLTAFNKRLQLSRGLSSSSLNMWQIVHYTDIDICTLTQSLPCCCLPCFFLLQLVHRQTQLSCTTLILTRARTWIEQALSSICLLCLCNTRTVHTVILISYRDSKCRNYNSTNSYSRIILGVEDPIQNTGFKWSWFSVGSFVMDQRSGRWLVSLDELKSSQPENAKDFPDFEMMDAKIASALNKIIPNSQFKKKVSLEEQKAQK